MGRGLRIADCGLRIDKTFGPDFAIAVEQIHKSAIRNPQSAITTPHSLFAFFATFCPFCFRLCAKECL
jgi:hypothetical protein